MQIITNFESSMNKFLDDRTSVYTITDLPGISSSSNIIMPNGFRVFVINENRWYQLYTTDAYDTSTYVWNPIVDSELNSESENPIQNKAVFAAINLLKRPKFIGSVAEAKDIEPGESAIMMTKNEDSTFSHIKFEKDGSGKLYKYSIEYVDNNNLSAELYGKFINSNNAKIECYGDNETNTIYVTNNIGYDNLDTMISDIKSVNSELSVGLDTNL